MACRLCGSKKGSRFPVGELSYDDCPDCGYLGLGTRHFPCRAAEEARYRLHRNDPAEPGYRRFLEHFIDLTLRPFVARGESILDFGSGPNPALATLLGEGGYRAEAYDPCFAASGRWKRRRWKAIAVHEVAEHLRFPRRTFEALARRLEPGGIIAIRTRFAPERVEDFAAWWYRQDSTHVGFFRPTSFAMMADSLGLDLALLAPPDMAVLRAGDRSESSTGVAPPGSVSRGGTRGAVLASDLHGKAPAQG